MKAPVGYEADPNLHSCPDGQYCEDPACLKKNAELHRLFCQRQLARLKAEWFDGIKSTRYPELAYARVGPGLWQFLAVFDYDRGFPQVGPQYKSEKELLADLERYAKFYGIGG